MPIQVERATRSLTLYDMPLKRRPQPTLWDEGISYPEDAYRCLILDLDFETARFL